LWWFPLLSVLSVAAALLEGLGQLLHPGTHPQLLLWPPQSLYLQLSSQLAHLRLYTHLPTQSLSNPLPLWLISPQRCRSIHPYTKLAAQKRAMSSKLCYLSLLLSICVQRSLPQLTRVPTLHSKHTGSLVCHVLIQPKTICLKWIAVSVHIIEQYTSYWPFHVHRYLLNKILFICLCDMLVWHCTNMSVLMSDCVYSGADAVASEKHFASNVPIERLWMWHIVMKMHDVMMKSFKEYNWWWGHYSHFDLTRIYFFGVEGKTELCWLWWDLEDSNIPGDGDRIPFNGSAGTHTSRSLVTMVMLFWVSPVGAGECRS